MEEEHTFKKYKEEEKKIPQKYNAHESNQSCTKSFGSKKKVNKKEF